MALKAGYKGIKKYIADKLNSLGDLDSLATDAEVAEQIAGQEKLLEDTVGWIPENLMTGFEAGGINRTTGQDESSTTLSRSVGYIPVVQGVVYKFKGSENYGYRVFTFDSSKNYIESEDSLKCSNGIGYYTAPTGVSYIRLLCVNAAVPDNPEFYKASVDKQLSTKADNSVIGTVEDGVTASQAYAVGSYFIRNGKFCTVTASISSGDTLTENTNYTSGDVAKLLNFESGSFTTPATNVTFSITDYIKYGHVMNVRLTFTASAEIASATDIGKCPYGRAGIHNQYLISLEGKIFYLTSSGTIRNDEVLQAGSYTVIGTVMV